MILKILFGMGFWQGYYTFLERNINPQIKRIANNMSACVEKKMNDKDHMAALFDPGNIAVIGASTTFGKWGQVIFSNIVAGGFKGNVFPVNPKGGKMFGLNVFRSVKDIPDVVDLAFITTPAKTVPGLLEELGEKAVKGAVVITFERVSLAPGGSYAFGYSILSVLRAESAPVCGESA